MNTETGSPARPTIIVEKWTVKLDAQQLTFDLVLRVVVTAASVPEREASKQVLSFGLPDGTKGFTAVFDLGR